MNRVFHPYQEWEEYKCGMWKVIHGERKKELFKLAVAFTGDAEKYGAFMLRVLTEWPISCEQNLTAQSVNRQAWIGHAACCIAIGCPEEITREAWHYLTRQQQDEANAKADIAITRWGLTHEEVGLEQLLLFGGANA